MFCPKCGAQNGDNAVQCAQCGAPLQPPRPGAPAANIPNYLVQSILATVFCCLPFGIPAIVFASQVNGKVASGDIAGAMQSSRKARMWCWISFGFGIGAILINVIFIIISAMAQQNQLQGM